MANEISYLDENFDYYGDSQGFVFEEAFSSDIEDAYEEYKNNKDDWD